RARRGGGPHGLKAAPRPVSARRACHASAMRQPRDLRAFHIRREPRDRYAVEVPLISTRGDLVIADTAGIRRLAAWMNILREPGAPSVQAGDIGALGLL